MNQGQIGPHLNPPKRLTLVQDLNTTDTSPAQHWNHVLDGISSILHSQRENNEVQRILYTGSIGVEKYISSQTDANEGRRGYTHTHTHTHTHTTRETNRRRLRRRQKSQLHSAVVAERIPTIQAAGKSILLLPHAQINFSMHSCSAERFNISFTFGDGEWARRDLERWMTTSRSVMCPHVSSYLLSLGHLGPFPGLNAVHTLIWTCIYLSLPPLCPFSSISLSLKIIITLFWYFIYCFNRFKGRMKNICFSNVRISFLICFIYESKWHHLGSDFRDDNFFMNTFF